MIKYLKFPNMSREELRQAIYFEAEKYFPMVKQEMVFDYVKLEPQDNSEKQLVLLAAVPKEIVMDYYEVFCAANLELVAVDIIPLALQRIFVPIANGRETFAIIHLGAEGTSLVVLANNRIDFARFFILVDKNDLGSYLYPDATISEGQQGMEVWQELVREVRRSLDYWRSQNQGKTLSHLYLTGLRAQIPSIEHFLGRELGFAVTVYHPLRGIVNSDEVLPPEYAVACGLAMRGVSFDEWD